MTSIVTAAFSSPWPSRRMPASERRTRPDSDQRLGVDRLAGIDPAGLDRRLQAADIDLGEVDAASGS